LNSNDYKQFCLAILPRAGHPFEILGLFGMMDTTDVNPAKGRDTKQYHCKELCRPWQML